jgi:hypothetical protein
MIVVRRAGWRAGAAITGLLEIVGRLLEAERRGVVTGINLQGRSRGFDVVGGGGEISSPSQVKRWGMADPSAKALDRKRMIWCLPVRA